MHGGTRWDSKKSACALQTVVCGLVQVPWRHKVVSPKGPSIIRTDAPLCMLTSWVYWSISADVTRGAEDLCECIHRVPEAAYKYWAQGQRPTAWPRSVRRVCLRRGRDQFNECACSLSKIDPSFYGHHSCRAVLFSSLVVFQIAVETFSERFEFRPAFQDRGLIPTSPFGHFLGESALGFVRFSSCFPDP